MATLEILIDKGNMDICHQALYTQTVKTQSAEKKIHTNTNLYSARCLLIGYL